VKVEIWSDIACPWCHVGRSRFEAALAAFEHRDEVAVVWRSFELDPAAPPAVEGSSAERLARKYGMSVERAQESQRRLEDVAAGDGLALRFDRVRSGNTFDAHRLIHLAQEHGLGSAMKERLMRAYFSEGALMSDRDTLAHLGVEVGLDEAEVVATLAGERYADAVRADERAAAALGINGVPTFVIDRALGVSGAQPPEELLAFLRQGWEAGDRTLVGADAAPGAVD
jgi:predicted DsbA family dithiol-disulfide isomerase